MQAFEQKLRDRAEVNRLREEKEQLQEKLESALAEQDSIKEVLQTECNTLTARMQEMEVCSRAVAMCVLTRCVRTSCLRCRLSATSCSRRLRHALTAPECLMSVPGEQG